MRFAALLLVLLAACGGHSKTGVKSAAEVTKLPPANPLAVTKMVQGVKLANDGSTRAHAIELLREAVQIDKNLWEAHYDLGVTLASAGDLAGAEDELKQALKLAPAAADVVVALAEVERRRGEDKDAADTLGDFLETHPEALDVRAQYVVALRNSGDVDKAIKEAHELLVRRSGNDPTTIAELALCHLAKGEKEVAILLAKQALDLNSKSAPGHRAMGLILLQNGDDANAFLSFQKASQADAKDTTARLNMGSVLMRAGVYPKAEEQYRKILEVVPDDADAQVGLAASLRGQADKHPEKLEEAKTVLEKVLEKDPHMVAAEFNFAVLYMDYLKRPQDARPLFKRYLSDAHPYHAGRADAEKSLQSLPAEPPPPPVAPAASGKPAAKAGGK